MPEVPIAGEDRFQALCLAFAHLRNVPRIFKAEGGRIDSRDGERPVDIQSEWFAAMSSLGDLRRRFRND